MTIRGQILTMTLLPPVGPFKTSPCVHSKRPRVYRHHAHMLKHMCAWCRQTRGRFECTHGGVFESTHVFFSRFFSVPEHTQTHTNTRPTTTPRPQRHTPHNTTRRQRQTETERDKEKRDRERETERETERERQRRQKERQGKVKEERQDKRR